MIERKTNRAPTFQALAALLVLLLWSGPVAAQADLDEALKLARQGKIERANELVNKVLASPEATLDVKSAMKQLVRAEILLTQSALEKDLDASQKLLDDSSELLASYLKSNPSMTLAADARRGIDLRLERKAGRIARAVKGETNAKRQSELLRRATESYDALSRHYRQRIADLKTAKGGADENELAEVVLDSSRALLDLARLPGIESDAKKRALDEAIDRLQDFQFDYADSVMSFEALSLEGQCQAELGDAAAARDRFTGAASLADRLVEARKEPTSYHRRVVGGAYVALAESYLESGQPREAATLVERAFAQDAGLGGEAVGGALKLEKAEALFQLEDVAGAHAIATEVLSTSGETPLAAAAKEKLRVWSAGEKLRSRDSPERVLIAAESFLENEQWLPALQAFRRAIELAKTPGQQARYEPDARFKMGQCFSRMGRHPEAVFAFEGVFQAFPESDLAPRACFEAVRSLLSEFAISLDPKDEALKESYLALLLKTWPNHPVARNVTFLQAEKLERAKQLHDAAQLYLKVPEDADAHEAAIVGAGRCYFLEGSAAWDAATTDAARDAAKATIAKSLEILARFFDADSNARTPTRGTAAQKLHAQNVFLATQQLAIVESHASVKRYEEALTLLESYARTLPQESPWIARIWALKIRPLLALDRVPAAVAALDLLLERFPNSPSAPASARSVAIHLEKTTAEMIQAGADPAAIAANLKKVNAYYLRWLKDALARNSRIPVGDAIALSDTLFRVARRLNGLDDSVTSVLDLAGVKVPEPQWFRDAGFVKGLLAAGKLGPLDEKDKLDSLAGKARAEGLTATNADGWERTKDLYVAIVKANKLLDAGGKIDPAALRVYPATLISVYLELGAVHLELAKAGRGPEFDAAFDIFQNVLQVTEGGSAPWWVAKEKSLAVLIERGTSNDSKIAKIILENLEKNYPDYGGENAKIKTRILDLKEKLAKLPSRSP